MNIKLNEEDKIKIITSSDLYGIMQRILLREDVIDQNREHFWIIGLATNLRLLFIEAIGLGSIRSVLTEPMDVFSFALQKRAVSIMLCHNHPSGELIPSDADKNTTDRMIQVGRIVNTPVLDHLIISTTSYISFANMGLMDQLAESTKFVPPYELIERYKKEAAVLAKKQEKKEIAKELKRRNMDTKTIAEITGLTAEEIGNLRVRRKKK